VITTAALGAAAVAFIAGAALPDVKGLQPVYANPGSSGVVAGDDRQAAQDRANRSKDRPGPALSMEQSAPTVWLLPLHVDYVITTLFEMRWGTWHYGVDMAAGWGTPFYAASAGTVILCRWNGGFGYNVQIDHGNGVVSIYGHSSKLLCHEGEHVNAGDLIGLVGDTGDSTGDHLHFQIDINGTPVDPIPFMLAHGVDIPNHIEAANGGIVIS
jgi:murein DD-endopeptidase MepM/ murein hydrolase activator NlpD